MTRLSASDLKLFSDCVEQLYQCLDIKAFPAVAMRLAKRLVPGHLVSYTEVNPNRSRTTALIEPPIHDPNAIAPAFTRLHRQHPAIDYYQRTGDGQATTISDFLSPADWHKTDIYKEIYKPMEVEDQMSINLPAPAPIVVGVVVSRQRRTFTERDRSLMNLFRSHLVAAYELADRHSRLAHGADTVEAGIESMSVGLIRVSPSGDVNYISSKARHWIEAHLEAPSDPARLPDTIDRWLIRSRKSYALSREGALMAAPLRITSGPTALEFRLKRILEDDALVVAECRDAAESTEALLALGLTRRESEVLYWVSEGKTNVEIGIILEMAARTVQKHLEHAFEKLGVNNRVAAALIAFEAMRR